MLRSRTAWCISGVGVIAVLVVVVPAAGDNNKNTNEDIDAEHAYGSVHVGTHTRARIRAHTHIGAVSNLDPIPAGGPDYSMKDDVRKDDSMGPNGPMVGDIVGVDTDAMLGGGAAHLTGHALTNGIFVEAVANDDTSPVPLSVERLWNGSTAIISLPTGSHRPCMPNESQPCVYRLRVTTTAGSTLTHPINAPELHWVRTFARPGDTVDVFGRRFWREMCVRLIGSHAVPCLPLVAVNENRIQFTIPSDIIVGVWTVSLRDSHGRDWNRSTVASGLSVHDTVHVIPPKPVQGLTINASEPPYMMDSSGTDDVTKKLYDAILAATANGTKPGGTVVVGPGRFLINSTAGCEDESAVYTAICMLPKHFAITLKGAGMSVTVFKLGSALGSFVQGTPISMSDLTVTDSGNVPNASKVYGNSMIGINWSSFSTSTSVQSASMIGSGLDWSSSVLMNNTDLTFESVHLISTQASATISLGNTQRLSIKNSIIDGGCAWFNSPLRGLTFTGNLVRNGGLGNGWGGSGMAIRLGAGHFSDLVFENNIFNHLHQVNTSGFAGRMFVSQHMIVERMYFANNTNLQAGPGPLSQQNSGEQILWETQDAVPVLGGAVSSVSGRFITITSSNILDVNSSDRGWSPLWSFYSRSGGAAASKRGAGNSWGYSHANAEYHAYCDIDENDSLCSENVTIGLVHIVQGRGIGQTRRIYGLSDENRTIELDTAFAIKPDTSSVLSFTAGAMIDLIARDIHITGQQEQVQTSNFTATSAIVVWDSGHRLTYSNFNVKNCRSTIKINSWRNSTLSDVVVKDITSNYTRSGVMISSQGHASDLPNHTYWNANQPLIGVSVRNVTVTSIPIGTPKVDGRLDYGSSAISDGGIAFGIDCGYDWNFAELNMSIGTSSIVIEDIHISNASIAINVKAPCEENPTAQIKSAYRFAQLLIRNIDAHDGYLGMLVDDNASSAEAGIAIYSLDITGFDLAINISWDNRFRTPYHGRGVGNAILQPRIQITTPLALIQHSASPEWYVKFRNVGLADGLFTLLKLDPRLQASSEKWAAPALSSTASSLLTLKLSNRSTILSTDSEPLCGVLSDGSTATPFCVGFHANSLSD